MPALAAYQGPSCPHCRAPLDLEGVVDGPQQCPACFRGFEAVRFQPAARRERVAEVGAGGPEESASCAAHRRNAAVAGCERCGIFMCALCRTECDGMVICAACFERLAQEGTLHGAATRYRNYLGLAWLWALLAVLPCMTGLVTGPAAIYCAMRSMRQMNEWGEVGGRGRAVGALALGVLGFVENGVVLAALFS